MGGRSSSVGNRTRKTPVGRRSTRRRVRSAPKIPESAQKRIEEMMASGRMKAPTTPRKTTPRKTVAKKAAPKSAIKSAISRGGRTGDKIISGLASSRRGKTVKGNPFLMGKSKAAPKKSVAKKKPVKPKLPEGVRSGGKTYTNPVSGDKMYQPPMPKVGKGRVQAMVMPTPINLTTGKPERLMISEPTKPKAPDAQQLSSDPKIAKLQKYFLDRGLGIPPRAESSFEEKEDYKEYLIDMKKDVRSNFGDPTKKGYKPEEAAYLQKINLSIESSMSDLKNRREWPENQTSMLIDSLGQRLLLALQTH